MHPFSATNTSHAVVGADREAIWAVLTDPVLLPRLTPLLERIVVDGSRWTWHLSRIPVLGVAVSPSFTEQMAFDAPRRIEYTHAPPAGVHERSAAEGWYELEPVAGGTHLAISLTLVVELPLSRFAEPAVRRVMEGVMRGMGERFAVNLKRHLRVTR